jgi:prevent-host-death family protein
MAKVPTIIPITDLRQDAAAAIKRAKDGREPIVITQRGRATAVMLSIEAYEQAESERELLLQIARGEREIELGEGITLESLLADADRLLSTDDS